MEEHCVPQQCACVCMDGMDYISMLLMQSNACPPPPISVYLTLSYAVLSRCIWIFNHFRSGSSLVTGYAKPNHWDHYKREIINSLMTSNSSLVPACVNSSFLENTESQY